MMYALISSKKHWNAISFTLTLLILPATISITYLRRHTLSPRFGRLLQYLVLRKINLVSNLPSALVITYLLVSFASSQSVLGLLSIPNEESVGFL